MSTDADNPPSHTSLWRAALRFAVILLLAPLVLFSAAGRLDWVMGWVYVALVMIFALASRLVVLRTSPELLAERAQSLEAKDAKAWDKTLMPLVVVGPLAMLVVAGLDQRNGWSPPIALAAQLIALAAIVLGYLFGTWAMAVNRFFSAVVRIQRDRQHVTVTTGPYRWVRHPAYASSILVNLAVPIMLGTVWALVPSVLTSLAVIVRTALEDKTLQDELPGYVEYTQHTRFRLVPGVW
jgi:protein-S-isoprenylcysteine O-methyltransferase Ste14